MKQILVLHISECGGHKRASENIKEALQSIDPHIRVLNINGFGQIYPWAERFINYLYTTTIKYLPQLWGKVYDKKPIIKALEPLKRSINMLGFRKFSKLVKGFNPHAIVATQAFPCGLACDFKSYFNAQFSIFAVVTDYHPHRFWIHPKIDNYIVPCKDSENTLIGEGVDKEKIKIFGIPISVKFLEACTRIDIASKYGFNPDLDSILVMGGGSGFGPIKDIVLKLDNLDCRFQVIVVCGTNKRLLHWFKKKAHKFKRPIFYFGYIDFVNILMDFADIIITKPGGITVSEALSKGLAIIVVNPIPGQEERNVNYLEEKNVILKTNSTKEIGYLVKGLLTNKDELIFLRQRSKSISQKDSSLKIADFILKSLS